MHQERLYLTGDKGYTAIPILELFEEVIYIDEEVLVF